MNSGALEHLLSKYLTKRYRNLQNIRIQILQIFVLIFLMNLHWTIWGKYYIKIQERLCDTGAIVPTFEQAKKS